MRRQIPPPVLDLVRTLDAMGVAVCVSTTAHAHLVAVTSAFRALCGLSDAPVVLEDWIALIHPEDRHRVVAEAMLARAARQPYSLTFRLRSGTGWRSIVGVADVMVGHEDYYLGRLVDCTEQAARAATHAAHATATHAPRDDRRRGLSVAQAAARLGVSASTVRRMVRAGALPAFRPGRRAIRIDAEALEAWLRRGRRREERQP